MRTCPNTAPRCDTSESRALLHDVVASEMIIPVNVTRFDMRNNFYSVMLIVNAALPWRRSGGVAASLSGEIPVKFTAEACFVVATCRWNI